ncbi:MAG: response regulator, partial [Spirochaetaceae bacterium]|nr:response regulator [Spirochaetaceae bacterium]
DLASDGLEALERMRRGTYDLLLLDTRMPGLDGFETARRAVAELPPGKRPWIVAVTAAVMEGDRERCLAAGMDGYIPKPIRLDELAEALRDCAAARGIAWPEESAVAEAAAEAAAESAADAPVGAGKGGFDARVFGEMLRSMGEEAAEVVDLYLGGTPEHLAKMRKAAAAGDAVALVESAHALKSTSSLMGAVALAATCADIERLVRGGGGGGGGGLAAASALVPAAEAEFAAAAEEIAARRRA